MHHLHPAKSARRERRSNRIIQAVVIGVCKPIRTFIRCLQESQDITKSLLVIVLAHEHTLNKLAIIQTELLPFSSTLP